MLLLTYSVGEIFLEWLFVFTYSYPFKNHLPITALDTEDAKPNVERKVPHLMKHFPVQKAGKYSTNKCIQQQCTGQTYRFEKSKRSGSTKEQIGQGRFPKLRVRPFRGK